MIASEEANRGYPERLKFKEEENQKLLLFGTELAHLGFQQVPCTCLVPQLTVLLGAILKGHELGAACM